MPNSGSKSGTALSINSEPCGLSGANQPSQATQTSINAIRLLLAPIRSHWSISICGRSSAAGLGHGNQSGTSTECIRYWGVKIKTQYLFTHFHIKAIGVYAYHFSMASVDPMNMLAVGNKV